MIYPMFAMVLLTIGVLLVAFRARVGAVRAGRMQAKYFRTYDQGDATEDVAKTSRHYVNLFEAPVLFYVACLAAMQIGADGPTMQALAWAFVATRVAHAYLHMGPNRLRPRMLAFGLGLIPLLAMWVLLCLAVASR